jgi:putative DNA primase/helicase
MATIVHGKGMQDAVALQFAKRHAETFRYVAKWNQWFEWTGTHWREEATYKGFDKARALLRESNDGAAKADANIVASVVALARTDRMIAATQDQWDRDPWLLGTPAGTVDLRNGELRKASPDDYITKVTAVAPDWDCPIPLWRKFINDITDSDKELQRYHQRVFGYCLTGDVSEDALFFFYGRGANGKGVELQTVAAMFGGYCKTAPTDLFTVATGERHPAELAILCGARLAVASETQKGKYWDEAKIKKLTGRDSIPARFMRQDWFEFLPTHKFIISGNHKPHIQVVDVAIQRRINLVPFLVVIPKQRRDPDLTEKLQKEWPGILAWMIDGCLEWQRLGLAPPPAVVKATEEYLKTEDPLYAWMSECCETGKSFWASSAKLFDSWKCWAKEAGETVGNIKWLIARLVERGFVRRKNAEDIRGLKVLRLK